MITMDGDWFAEKLQDELKCLDLRLHLQIRRQRDKNKSNHLEEFLDFVLSEEEISRLLTPQHVNIYGRELDEASEPDCLPSINTLAKVETVIRERRTATLQKHVFLSLPDISRIFHLTSFEEQCLIICLASELDRKYEKIYAFLQDDIHLKSPAVGLVSWLVSPVV
jgi:hypothetical protein